jgi:putative FmdB family regulatory protein
MAIYEYICKDEACRFEWEEESSINSQPSKTCPQCNQETAKRLISGGGSFVLVGNGWFKSGGY